MGSVNPYCTCDPCTCGSPCTCGLVHLGHSTDETWDAGALELRYVVTDRYGPRPPTGPGVGTGHGAGSHGHGSIPASEETELADPADLLVQAADADRRRSAVIAAQARGATEPHTGGHASVRSAVHKGHRIEVVTTYQILVDGQELDAHMGVDNDGTVHYHGLPNYSEASAVDLVRRVIDAFPDDYAPVEGSPPDGDPPPAGGRHEGGHD